MSFTINIDESILIPKDFYDFTEKEKTLVIRLGTEVVIESKKSLARLSYEELTKKIKEETKAEIKKVELDLLIEKELSKRLEDKYKELQKIQSETYKNELEHQKKLIDSLKKQIHSYESDISKKIEDEVNKEKNKYMILLEEKDKQNEKNREVFLRAEKSIMNEMYMSARKKGDIGEDIFGVFADTFKDFKGYKIQRRSEEGHKGDFHMFFDEFNVLVDIKNYTGSIQSNDSLKIERDLIINNGMNFAWLISLNTDIHGYSRFPIMYKWIVTDFGLKCIIFVNNFLKNDDPINLLRTLWNISFELTKFIKKTSNEEYKISKMQEIEYSVYKRIKFLQDRTNELRRNLNVSLNILKEFDNETIEILKLVSNEVIETEVGKTIIIDKWWNENIEFDDETELKLKSTELWSNFKKLNEDVITKKLITIDIFKKEIKKYVSTFNFEEKSKGGCIVFSGIKFKPNNKVVDSNIDLDVESNAELTLDIVETNKLPVKNLKNKKIKQTGEKLEKELQDKIINEYNLTDKNMLELAVMFEVEPYKIITVLLDNKIVSKRQDIKGYDLHIKTPEYLSKIPKK